MTKSIPPRFNECIQSSSAEDSNTTNIEARQLATRSADNEHSDPFLHYSNDVTRMNHLRMLNSDVSPGTSTPSPSSNEEPSSSTYVQRRSILSFELHSSLVLEDDLQDMLEGDEEVTPATSNESNGSDDRDQLQQGQQQQQQQQQPTESGVDKDEETDVSQMSKKSLLKMLLKM